MTAAAPAELQVTMEQLLRVMVDKQASDMHLTVGNAPLLRIDGQVLPLKLAPLNGDQVKQLLYSVLTEEQKVHFERSNEVDFSFGIRGVSRFRANAFMQRANTACVFRQIPLRIPTMDELGLPPVIHDICNKPRGLVLVTGATGSGKSTTLAAMIDKINSEQRMHILTIEDPIEFWHPHKLCLVNQRQIGQDTANFGAALKFALRQDPDVILVGEMRDLETVSAALTAAETGHLVFATLHTNSAISTINRVIDVFPPHQQGQVRAQLSFSLMAVITQQLLSKASGQGRAMAMEVMIPNPAIRNLIREDKLHQIYSQMQMGQGDSGMQTMNQALASLIQRNVVTMDEGIATSSDQDELKQMLQGPQVNQTIRRR